MGTSILEQADLVDVTLKNQLAAVSNTLHEVTV